MLKPKLKMSKVKNFYIIEARDNSTNSLEKRRLYTSTEQYTNIGSKQIDKFRKLYNVKVTKYVCNNESVELLNIPLNK
jgi:hypothetical protein